MANVTVNVFGAKELEALFKELPRKMAATILRKGMTEGARLVRDCAKDLVPVRTGELKRSIKVRGLQSAKAAGYQRKMGFGKGGGMPPIGKEVVASAFYAHIIEKGRKGVEAANGGMGFLAPAGEIMEPQVRQAIADSVAESLKDARK